MSQFQRAILALAIVTLLIAAWMGRYSMASGARPFLLDRWTGKVLIPEFSLP